MAEVSVSTSFSSLVKPTVDTPLHIDYDWWERNDFDIGVELKSHLCQEHREAFGESFDAEEKIDWVDEETGEVRQVNGVQHIMQVHCSKEPDYIAGHLPLVDAVFRVFLARGNKPMSCRELSNVIGIPAERILRTLTGGQVYKGIRPVHP